LTATAEPLPAEEAGLTVFDTSLVPSDPPPESLYLHKPDFFRSLRELLHRGEIIYTLAERDIKAQYKQAVLGISWALLLPLVNLAVLTLLVHHVTGFGTGSNVPLILSMYVGLLTWGFFGGAIGGGSNSLVGNKLLMAKSHFPRECFPLSQVLGSAFTSLMAVAPLFVLFGIEAYWPRATSVWAPLYLLLEIPFTVGIVLLVSSVIVQMRDLQQVVPILLPLAMLFTVLRPVAAVVHGHIRADFVHGSIRYLYALVNPMAPIITNMRLSVLQGVGPLWGLLAWATVGAFGYLVIGYTVFKRLEVNFADLT
jgi:lipopolysaccharide transport system permease protein